jgi:pimeloyl-ACP methyl ester carboxylesterase
MDRTESLSGPLNYYRAAARETVETELRSLLPGNDRTRRQVDIPTHVVWGEQDPVLGLDLLDGLQDVASALTVTRLPDASHWPHLERPQRVTDDLLATLE